MYIVTGDLDISAYDTILLGFLIWWYVAPTIINTFLETYDFSGKTICCLRPPAEAGSGGLQASTPSATIREGKLSNGRQTSDSLRIWAETL